MEKSCGSIKPANITSTTNTINVLFSSYSVQLYLGDRRNDVPTGWKVNWRAVEPGEIQRCISFLSSSLSLPLDDEGQALKLYPLSSTFIHFHSLFYTFIHFHPHSSTFIPFHPYSSTFIHFVKFHPFIHFHPISSTFIHFHPFNPLSPTSIHFNPFSSIFIHFHPFSSIFIHFHPFSSTFIHFH